MDEQRNEYRTGRTEPEKKHNGIIAFLLILVIFLGGLASMLGILNIHLFRLLDEQEGTAPVSFAPNGEDTASQATDALIFAGMTIVEIPALYQTVHDLPAGLYISHVQDNSAAARAGILAGDVLETVAGTPVTSLTALQDLTPSARGQVTVTVCREGQHNDITLEVTP